MTTRQCANKCTNNTLGIRDPISPIVPHYLFKDKSKQRPLNGCGLPLAASVAVVVVARFPLVFGLVANEGTKKATNDRVVSELLAAESTSGTTGESSHHTTITLGGMCGVRCTVLVVVRGIGVRWVRVLVVSALLGKLLRGTLLLVAAVRILVTTGNTVRIMTTN